VHKIGLIDVGSNTIKMAVYSVEGKQFVQDWYHAEYAYLVSCMEQGNLSQEGIRRAGDVIGQFAQKAKELNCEQVYCFSTASLRWVKNQEEVIRAVRETAGIQIHPISGEEEARYNFLSMRAAVKEDTFIGGDLGGGSAQLFYCQQGNYGGCESFPIGALKLKEEFVAGAYPDPDEMGRIKDHVKKTIAQFGKGAAFSRLYMMGGTMRLASQLLGAKQGEPVLLNQMNELLNRYLSDLSAMEREVSAIQPERKNTILPGLGVLTGLAEQLGAQELVYLQVSVREGLLMDRFLTES
jgi:exopolyphosphatase/guanosine-5'-triphosphate,3'-diphosphate pyrophosphatase